MQWRLQRQSENMNFHKNQLELFLYSGILCDDFFISILINKLHIDPESFKLKLVLLSPATDKNENFVSVDRAKIKIEMSETKILKTIDVIIKVLLSKSDGFKSLAMFPRETLMYQFVLPAFENIWVVTAHELTQFAPKCLKVEREPYELIVLEDLQSQGYNVLNSIEGLNFEQAKLVLVQLAKFHAASAVFRDKIKLDKTDSDLLNRKRSMIIREDDPVIKGSIALVKAFKKALASYADCHRYLEKISKWNMTKVVTTFTDVAIPMQNGFEVLNHGDLWTDNILFNDDHSEVKFIDFQLSFWGGPAADLSDFLITSVDDAVKVASFYDLIEIYHQSLLESLQKLKYVGIVPSLKELHFDLLDKGFYGRCNYLKKIGFITSKYLLIACTTSLIFKLLLVKQYTSKEINLEETLYDSIGSKEMLRKAFSNPIYETAIKAWLPFLDENGFLDCLIT